ncbi:MAG: isochorismate synthase [Planctomycetota bacterium]
MISDPIQLWSEAVFPRTMLWDESGIVLSEGVTWQASASGPGRSVGLARALGRLEGGSGGSPWVMGALAFEETGSVQSPWGDLPGGRLWLPSRLRVERAGITLDQRSDRPSAAVERQAPAPWHHAPTEFRELVEDAAGLVRDGAFRKVVIARATDETLPKDHRDDVAIARLRAAGGSGATIFAHDLPDGALFLGATPELLLSARQHVIETHALAGTCSADVDEAVNAARIAALLGSTKERKEHGLVVEHLVAALRPRCRPFAVESAPHPRRAGGLIHLETRIAAELAVPDHLDAITALHPTPATCGLPVATAAHWLARHEKMQRGLYCGALGWLGTDNCRVIVPLRCALLSPDRRHARCFAGVGVVDTSDANAELEETESKLALVRRALRIAGHG